MSLVGSTVTGNSADGTGAGIYDNGYLAISNKSVVCNNFVYSSTLYESDLAIGYFGHVKISGGSKVC